MTKNLLIVESPSKAKTLKKYLGSNYEVLASYGHVRDLMPKSGAVDPNNNFEMKYQLIAKNSKHLSKIIEVAEQVDHVFLATDPDREGEAISWHLTEILRSKRKLKNIKIQRVTFNEITKSAVLEAMDHPRELSQFLIDAQLARRALDYLVGFNLSPLLWKKIRRGLSAGRVQSPALRMICERENEISAFESQEYWSVHLDSQKSNKSFSAKMTHFDGKKLEQFDIPTQQRQDEILKSCQNFPAIVSHIEKKKRIRKPTAPFTTSTLQQESVRKLFLSTNVTMRVAQQLYEGIDVGQGAIGLITYMRTDSVTLSNEAITEIRHYIEHKVGPDFLPKSANLYKTKTKNAQEAHEAIRPTSIYRTPEMVKPFLTQDQFKLYQIIWKRTIASQMTPAKFDLTSIDIKLDKHTFRTTGQVQVFAGFLSVYEESQDEQTEEDKIKLPVLKEGEEIPIINLYGEQHFTQPPPRFTEASLVKTLEEYGIGRPSTYASIISTLKDREYVDILQKQFIPTDTGMIVNKFLTEHFTQYVDYQFTANMEDDLDGIANGKKNWVTLMKSFWKGFDQQLKEKADISRAQVTTEELNEICPQCKEHKLQTKFGKRGKFIACSGYPDCDYTRSFGKSAEEAEKEKESLPVIEDRDCPECGGKLTYKQGKFGKFIACTNYPKCKYIESLEKPKDTGIECPLCHKGSMIERKSRYGKIFYSCNTYPKCTYAVWNPPINEPCPKCNWPIMSIKTTKRRGTEKVCPQKECGYSEVVEAPEGKVVSDK